MNQDIHKFTDEGRVTFLFRFKQPIVTALFIALPAFTVLAGLGVAASLYTPLSTVEGFLVLLLLGAGILYVIHAWYEDVLLPKRLVIAKDRVQLYVGDTLRHTLSPPDLITVEEGEVKMVLIPVYSVTLRGGKESIEIAGFAKANEARWVKGQILQILEEFREVEAPPTGGGGGQGSAVSLLTEYLPDSLSLIGPLRFD